MKENSERIVLTDFIQNQTIPFSIGTDLTLLFGLRGRCSVTMTNRSEVLRAGCLIALAPMSLYSISGKNNAGLLRIRIRQSILHMAGFDHRISLDCVLSENDDRKTDRHMKEITAALFRTSIQRASDNEIRTRAVETVSWLYGHYAKDRRPDQVITEQNLARVERVLEELKTNWRSPLSLSRIAETQYVSESYLSRIFRKYTGFGYLECLTEVRLGYALNDLRYTDKTITEIAFDNGFANTNAFISQFRKKYKMTPGTYRKQIHQIDIPEQRVPENVEAADWMQALLRYDVVDAPIKRQKRKVAGTVLVTGGKPFNQTWHEILNVGYALDLLMGSLQTQVRRVQSDIGFRYFRVRGILDDDLYLYHEDAAGEPVCNFDYADRVTDFILDCGALPFIELSWIPARLARRPVTFWDNHSVVAPPADLAKWTRFLSILIRHWAERYGKTRLAKWRFSPLSYSAAEAFQNVWDYKTYLNYFVATREAVKSVSPHLQFGGCGFFCDAAIAPDRGLRLLKELSSDGRMPDFLTVQCFSHDITVQDENFISFSADQSEAPSIVSADPDFTRHFLEQYRQVLTQRGYSSLPLIVENCMVSLWQRDLSSDTLFRASWLCRTILDNLSSADGFGYLQASDWYNEVHEAGAEFRGSPGLITRSGIAKPAYRLLQMLNRVKGHLIVKGPGYSVFREDDTVQVVFCHYCHYEDLYRMRYKRLDDPHMAYDIFPDQDHIHYEVTLTGLTPGRYRIRTEILTRDAGSSFDGWLRMGAPYSLTAADAACLDMTSIPGTRVEHKTVDSQICLEADLKPHEINMVTLTPVL